MSKKPKQSRLLKERRREPLQRGWGYCSLCGKPTMSRLDMPDGSIVRVCYKCLERQGASNLTANHHHKKRETEGETLRLFDLESE